MDHKINKVAFRRGYLSALAANGITPDDIAGRAREMSKTAAKPMMMLTPESFAPVGDALRFMLEAPVLPAAGIAVGGGLGIGTILHALKKNQAKENLRQMRNQEREAAYKNEINRVARRLRRRELGAATG